LAQIHPHRIVAALGQMFYPRANGGELCYLQAVSATGFFLCVKGFSTDRPSDRFTADPFGPNAHQPVVDSVFTASPDYGRCIGQVIFTRIVLQVTLLGLDLLGQNSSVPKSLYVRMVQRQITPQLQSTLSIRPTPIQHAAIDPTRKPKSAFPSHNDDYKTPLRQVLLESHPDQCNAFSSPFPPWMKKFPAVFALVL